MPNRLVSGCASRIGGEGTRIPEQSNNGQDLGVDPYQAKLLAVRRGFVAQRSDSTKPLKCAQLSRKMQLPAGCQSEGTVATSGCLVGGSCLFSYTFETQPEDLWLSTDGMPTIIAEAWQNRRWRSWVE